MWNKDVLDLIFQEIECGKDMINFNEISRRCNQIFHQHIWVNDYQHGFLMAMTKKKNNELHGLMCRLNDNGRVAYYRNYVHNKLHGQQHGWYDTKTQPWYIDNYYHGKKHGRQLEWGQNGKVRHDIMYRYGQQIIEK